MLSPEEILEPLNDKQAEAVTYPLKPLQVFAGPGTGKTRVLTHRIAYLVASNQVEPRHVCAITFTNKAAGEMKNRLEGMLGEDIVKAMTVSTVHSLGVRILRSHADKVGRKKSFLIYDDGDQKGLLKKILEERGSQLNAGHVMDFINAVKTGMPTDSFEHAKHLMSIKHDYDQRLLAANAFDFNDLITAPADIFRQHPEVLQEYQDRYRCVLVDEYQDTNFTQYALINLLARKSRCLTVVGDDDQSIYGWNGADYRNIMAFQKDYPEAHTVVLEQNYRSHQSFLDLAMGLIRNNEFRTDKQLWSDRNKTKVKTITCRTASDLDEAAYVAKEIQRLANYEGIDFGGCAILYRTNAQSRALEAALIKHRIPYQIANGTSFYERKEIRDMMAYVRFMVNMNDEMALRRLINSPSRGIGPKTADMVVETSHNMGADFLTTMNAMVKSGKLPKRQHEGMDALTRALNQVHAVMPRMTVKDMTERLLETTGYNVYLESLTAEERDARSDNVMELLGFMESYSDVGEAAVNAFLEDVSLVADVDSLNNGESAVTLATLHKSKGLEFPVVFLTGAEEGLLPSERSQEEEERRLMYVGITRAKDRLYITHSGRRQKFGKIEPAYPSSFIDELSPDLVQEIDLDVRSFSY